MIDPVGTVPESCVLGLEDGKMRFFVIDVLTRSTTTSTRPGDHVRVNHAHPRCGIDQWSV